MRGFRSALFLKKCKKYALEFHYAMTNTQKYMHTCEIKNVEKLNLASSLCSIKGWVPA